MRILRNQRGAVVALAVLAIPVMLAMGALIIDMGNLYWNKAQLSNAADAAALAAAQELPRFPTQAERVADEYLRSNGYYKDNNDHKPLIVLLDDNRAIEVTLTRDVTVMFAGIFGQTKVPVTAKAKAQVSIAAAVPWIVPFVIPKTQYYDYTHQFTMRMYNPAKLHGDYEFDYMNVGIENTNFQQYIYYLKYGYQKKFAVGQNMQYLGPSSGGRESVEAFYDRTVRDSNTDYTKAEAGDPRIMLIPIVEKMLPRNTSTGTQMKILGFAAFFLEEVHKGTIQKDGNYGITFYAKGRFIKDLNVGPCEGTTDATCDFGVRTIQLVKASE